MGLESHLLPRCKLDIYVVLYEMHERMIEIQAMQRSTKEYPPVESLCHVYTLTKSMHDYTYTGRQTVI